MRLLNLFNAVKTTVFVLCSIQKSQYKNILCSGNVIIVQQKNNCFVEMKFHYQFQITNGIVYYCLNIFLFEYYC